MKTECGLQPAAWRPLLCVRRLEWVPAGCQCRLWAGRAAASPELPAQRWGHRQHAAMPAGEDGTRVGQGNARRLILFLGSRCVLIRAKTLSIDGGEVVSGAGSAAVGCFGQPKHPQGVSGWFHSLTQRGGFGVGVAGMGHSCRPCTMAQSKLASSEIVPY